MLASEIIQSLTDLIEEFGDLRVVVNPSTAGPVSGVYYECDEGEPVVDPCFAVYGW